MKVKRFITEYANSKITLYDKLSKEYPHQKDTYYEMSRRVYKAVRAVERGLITDDECIRLILESASASY